LGGGERLDGWAHERQRSLTSGPTDAWGPPGSEGGEGNGCGPASRQTGPDGAANLGRREGIDPQGFSKMNFPFYLIFLGK
jgi:hypothetical protein